MSEQWKQPPFGQPPITSTVDDKRRPSRIYIGLAAGLAGAVAIGALAFNGLRPNSNTAAVPTPTEAATTAVFTPPTPSTSPSFLPAPEQTTVSPAPKPSTSSPANTDPQTGMTIRFDLLSPSRGSFTGRVERANKAPAKVQLSVVCTGAGNTALVGTILGVGDQTKKTFDPREYAALKSSLTSPCTAKGAVKDTLSKYPSSTGAGLLAVVATAEGYTSAKELIESLS